MSLKRSKVGSRSVRILFVTLLLLILCLVTSTSVLASKHTGPQTWTVDVGLESSDFAIQGMLYAPSDITVHEGDTIHWVAQSHDIHTVTFLGTGQTTLPPFDFSPGQIFPNHPSGSTYDGVNYFNSGLLTLSPPPPGISPPTTYDLVMGKTGKFDYFCIVHGTMMHGVVRVLPTSAELPRDQEDVQKQIAKAKTDVLREGHELNEQALDTVAKKHIVLVGIGEMAKVGMVEIVRFFPEKITVDVGQTLTFVSESMMPHTFTITTNPNLDVFSSVGDGTNYKGGDFNRLVLPGDSFTLKVTAPLDVDFFCAFHDTLGMVGHLTAEAE